MDKQYIRSLHAPFARRVAKIFGPRSILALILLSLLLNSAVVYMWLDWGSDRTDSMLRRRTHVLLISGHWGTMVDFGVVGRELGVRVTESGWLSKTLSISREEAMQIWERCVGVGVFGWWGVACISCRPFCCRATPPQCES